MDVGEMGAALAAPSMELPYLKAFGDWALRLMAEHGYLAIFLVFFIQEMGIPMPVISGTVLLLFSGYMVYSKEMNFALTMVVAICAVLMGASILYVVMRRGGRPLLYRYARFIRVRDQHLARAEELVSRYGAWAFIFGRLIPSLRVWISVFGSLLGTPYPRYMLNLFIGCVLWSGTYIAIGYFLGPAWEEVGRFIEERTWVLSVAVAVLLLGLSVRYYWSHRARRQPARAGRVDKTG